MTNNVGGKNNQIFRWSTTKSYSSSLENFIVLNEVYLSKNEKTNFKFFESYSMCIFDRLYRKLPLKNTGDTLKGPDGTVLVTAHWGF